MKLSISKRENAGPGPLASWDLIVKLNDQDITTNLQSLDLSVSHDSAVSCALKVFPNDIEVDADVLAELVAIAKHDTHRETP